MHSFNSVAPAKAGDQFHGSVRAVRKLDPGLRRDDGPFGVEKRTKEMAGTSPAMMHVARGCRPYAGTSCLPNSFSLAGALAVAQRKFQV